MASCGECTLCCKTHIVPELKKPKLTWCKHCVKKKGCGIYETRPESCREFNCMWLQSQDTEYSLPPQLRPDRCGVVLATPGDMLTAHVNDGVNLHGTMVGQFLNDCKARGLTVAVIRRYKTTLSNPSPQVIEMLKREV